MPRLTGVDKSGKVVGEIVKLGGATLPNGVLPCDGSTVSQTTYANLFATIGTTFNIGGEAGGTFRLPDMRGRSPMGDGTGSGLTTRSNGQQVGVETHALSSAQIPSHTHGLNANTGSESVDHSHAWFSGHWGGNGPLNSGTELTVSGGGGSYNNGNTGGRNAAHTHNLNTTTDGGTGGSGSHPNIHPVLVVKFGIVYL